MHDDRRGARTDEELERLAEEKGSSSIEAKMLGKLRSLRAKDRQAYAFKFDRYMIAGSTPDAGTEQIMIELAEDVGGRRITRLPFLDAPCYPHVSAPLPFQNP